MPSNHLILYYLLFLPSIFPSIRVFSTSQLFSSGCQSTGASASVSVFPVNIQDWFPLGLTDLISLQSKELSRVFSSTTVPKHQFFGSAFFMAQLSHLYKTTAKTVAFTKWAFVGKVISLLLNTLSRFVIAFVPRSKRLLILWLISYG